MNALGTWLRETTRTTSIAWLRLGVGLGISFLALTAGLGLLAIASFSLISLGLPLLPFALYLLRAIAGLERRRLSRVGAVVGSPYRHLPGGWWPNVRTMFTDPATWRDLSWLLVRGLFFFVDLIALALPLSALRDLTFPLWWQLLPMSEAGSSLGFKVETWPGAIAVALTGPVWLALAAAVTPFLSRTQDHLGRRLLSPPPNVDLSARISELTATRAAALDAHTAELRRIERALHDGAQNRLVGVAILTGAARRAVARDPVSADVILERAQTGAEEALAELRTVIRGILPPILAQRGLGGALSALAAGCGVPCEATVDVPGRCPTSVEATAYFVVAEALTNVSKHSGATHASVNVERIGDVLRIRVEDYGKGGAHESHGSGITGLHGRVAAHDGTALVSSPIGGPTIISVELPCGS